MYVGLAATKDIVCIPGRMALSGKVGHSIKVQEPVKKTGTNEVLNATGLVVNHFVPSVLVLANYSSRIVKGSRERSRDPEMIRVVREKSKGGHSTIHLGLKKDSRMYRPWLQCVFRRYEKWSGMQREERKGALVPVRTRTNCEVKAVESVKYIKTKFNVEKRK